MLETHSKKHTPNVRKPLKTWARTPEEEEVFQRMQAKCEARAHPIDGSSGVDADTHNDGSKVHPCLETDSSGIQPVEPGPAATLTWIQKSKYLMISGCAQFHILKECVGNVSRNGVNYSDGKIVYQCWRRVDQLWYIKFEPHQPTFEAAKGICEAYATAHPIGQKSAIT